MVGHLLSPDVPEDVAHAESRIRSQTIAAEDVLHDIGAISMMGSDSQGMGRITEVIVRTWQLASKMREARGRLPEETSSLGDNERIKRFIAKYTINAARTFGIDDYVGSLEPGKMADLVIWDPSHFGVKPRAVFKPGYCVWSMMGDGTACLNEVEPVVSRPQWGAFGKAPLDCGVNFVHPLALTSDVAGRAQFGKKL